MLLQKPTDGWPPRCQQSISAILKHSIPVSDFWTRWWKRQVLWILFLSRPQLFGDNRDSEVDFIWSLHITKGACCGWDDIYCENPQGKWPAELITTVFWTVTSQLRRKKGLAFQNISAFFNWVHAIYCIGVYIHKPTFYFLTGPHSASVHVILSTITLTKSNWDLTGMLNYINQYTSMLQYCLACLRCWQKWNKQMNK